MEGYIEVIIDGDIVLQKISKKKKIKGKKDRSCRCLITI